MSPEPMASVVKAITLPDGDYFTLDAPATTALQKRVAQIVKPPPFSGPPSNEHRSLPEVRAISAPTQLDLKHHKTFPLLLAEVRSNRREWEVHSRQNRLLLVSNLTTGTVEVMAPMDKGRRMPELPASGSGAPPDELNARLSSVVVRPYDLLTWFSPKALEGNLALMVLDYDLVSNPFPVRVEGMEPAPVNGASLADAIRINVRYTLPKPGPMGVRLQVPTHVRMAAPAIFQAEVRLSRSRVTAIDAPRGSDQPLLLAASLLLVQLDGSMPVLSHFKVPAVLNPQGEVETAFDIDMRVALAGQAAPGDWLAYFIVGDTITGPNPLKIVGEHIAGQYP